jgi:hypothetical protein
MGEERFCGFGQGSWLALQRQVSLALQWGASENAIDNAFVGLGDQPRAVLAYREFERLVKHNVELIQAAQRQQFAAAETPKAEPAPSTARLAPAGAEVAEATAEPAVKRGATHAVDGHKGIHERTNADGGVSYLAAWPNPDKPGSSLKRGGFATVEEAVEFRAEQIGEPLPATA